ncbi:hypothetical protein [Streptomyces sp. Wb2n-11]|uniref:hypothetical protein n=1 Tax=Streptomyces sp. Wb2n-11 TaxID=1030533 RepID=UPI000A573BC1|nr:hypothetical protein [Streptomyces sp. Wb2n-11]
MDQGILTIVGVIAGSAGAITAATITARGARRHQAHTQRRDKRRDAYAAFLAGVHEFHAVAYPHGANGFASDPDPEREEYGPTWQKELSDAYRKLSAAHPLVRLEGPDEVEDAALAVMNAALTLRMNVNNFEQRHGSGGAELNRLDLAEAAFLAQARKALEP